MTGKASLALTARGSGAPPADPSRLAGGGPSRLAGGGPSARRRRGWTAVGGKWRHVARAGMAGLVIAVASAGCNTSVVSNQSVSVCYRAIPVGRAAVHDPRAVLLGVHRVPADRVRPHLPASARVELGPNDSTAVCAMAFKGSFAAGQVDLAPGGEQGSYALVIVTAKNLKLLAAAVFTRPPRGFGGRVV